MLLDLQFCTHIPSYEMVKYYYLFRIVKMFGEKTGLQSLFLCSFRIFPEFLFSFVFVSCRIRFELCCLTRKKEGSSVCGGNVQMVTDVHTYASMLLSCHPGSIGSEWLRIDSRTHPKVPRMVKGFGQFSFTNSMWEFFVVVVNVCTIYMEYVNRPMTRIPSFLYSSISFWSSICILVRF